MTVEMAPRVREIAGADGTRFRLRPIRDDDAPRLVALHERLKLATVYQRFFSVLRRLPPDWARLLATVDHRRREALVIEHGPEEDPELVALGQYEPTADPATVEVAFVVEDRWQSKGLGTILFQELLRAAEGHGIRKFQAFILADNTRMVDLVSRFTEIRSRSLDQGVLTLDFVPSRPLG